MMWSLLSLRCLLCALLAVLPGQTIEIVDAGGDLAALCDQGGTNQSARVAAQYTYDAYGAVVTTDHIHAHAYAHLGHKCLFVDRLDIGVSAAGSDTPRLVPFAQHVYQNRNRAYSPALGRYLQRDPNQTALALLSAAHHGREVLAIVMAFDVEGLYGDGANLYEYLGSSPWTRSDPLGLSWDPFDMVDEYLAEDAGSKAAFLERIVGPVHTVAYLTAYVASWLPFPIVGELGHLALSIMGEPGALARSDWWYHLKEGEAALGDFLHLIGEAALAAMETSIAYGHSYGRFSVGPVGSLTGQGVQYASVGGLGSLLTASAVVGGAWLMEPTDVYVGLDKAKKVVYVGTSVDVARRARQHGPRFVNVEQITKKKLPRIQAWSIESALINRHKPRGLGGFALQNKRLSIGPRRAIFGIALDFGERWVRKFRPELW
jgi:hypothetical protein